MKFKFLKISSLLQLILVVHSANAQTHQNIYYLKNDQTHVATKDSADYVRVVREPDEGTVLYNVTEYYKNGKPKLIGKSSVLDYDVLEGQCIHYYHDGTKQALGDYKEGKPIGMAYEFYPNGKPCNIKEYPMVYTDAIDTGNENYYKILSCNDSTGKALATDGNGYYVGYSDDFKEIYEQGHIKNGLRDGLWTGTTDDKNPIKFKEQYQNGKLISGTAAADGEAPTQYTIRGSNPVFGKGKDAFNAFLTLNIEYPAYARHRNIQGRVYVAFVVQKDGRLSDLKVLSSPDEQLSAESIHVIKRSPKWKPGTKFGRAVPVHYTVPVNFSIADITPAY